MDAVIADLEGTSRTSSQYWLPTRSEAASMEMTCIGRTSVAPGILYDPTNTEEIIEFDDDDEQSNSTIVLEYDLAEPPIFVSGGYTSFSGRGIGTYVLGILLLGVIHVA